MDGAGNVVARHDYLPFGEELWAGVGMRTTAQQFGAMDQSRMRYALTEKDDTTGLDHTWWRKYENTSGRWTTPDPIRGSIRDAQSFNAYIYARNDPGNLIDPTGLLPRIDPCEWIDGQLVCYGPSNTFTNNTRASSLSEYLWVINSRFSVYQGRFGGRGSAPDREKDCYEFADEVSKLAASKPDQTNVEFRDLLMERFSNSGSEFGSDGFKTEFQDYSGTRNQARHYVGGLFAGHLGNPLGGRNAGSTIANLLRETTVILVPQNVGGTIVPVPQTLPANDSQKADRALNVISGRHGADLHANRIRPADLAGLIRKDVCAAKP